MIGGDILKNNIILKMNSYLPDEMKDEFKILVLYVLKDIEIVDTKKIIWEKIFDIEDEELENWIEDQLEQIYLNDDSYYSYLDNYYSDGYYTD